MGCSRSWRALSACWGGPFLAAFLFVGLVYFWLIPPIHFRAMIDWRLYAVMNWSMVLDGLYSGAWCYDRRPRPPARLSFGLPRGAGVRRHVPADRARCGDRLFGRDLLLVYDLCGRLFPSIGALTDRQKYRRHRHLEFRPGDDERARRAAGDQQSATARGSVEVPATLRVRGWRSSPKAGPGARPVRRTLLILGLVSGNFDGHRRRSRRRGRARVEPPVVPPGDAVTAGRRLFHPVEFGCRGASPGRRQLARLRHADAASQRQSGRPGTDGNGAERRGAGAWQGQLCARRLPHDVHVAECGAAARPVGPGHPALCRWRLPDRELPGAQRDRKISSQQAPQPGEQALRLRLVDQALQIDGGSGDVGRGRSRARR